MDGFLDKTGLTTPQVTTNKILLEGDNLKDLLAKTDINLPTLSSRWDSDFAENVGWVKSEGQWLNGNAYRDAYDLMVSRIGINDKFVAATVGTELTDENADKFLIDTTAVKFRLPLINGERVLVQKIASSTSLCDIYSDGYCEQNGELTITSTKTTHTFTIPFNTKPFITFHRATTRNASSYDSEIYPRSISSTNFKYGMNRDGINYARWSAIGFTNVLPSISNYNCNTYLFFKLADEVPSTVVNTQQIVDDLHEEAINFKNECSATLAQGDFVVETYTNGTSWYRLYHSGWVEQGGESSAEFSTITFIKEFANTNYSFISHVMTKPDSNSHTFHGMYYGKTTTGISNVYVCEYGTVGRLSSNYIHCWEAKGFIKTTE